MMQATTAQLDDAKAEEKRGQRLRREGKDKEAIEAYEKARALYVATDLHHENFGNNDVTHAIKRCDTIVSNIRHPKEQRTAAITQRPNCLCCGKPLRRFKFDGMTFDDGTPREWGDYGDQRFCGLRCGWSWACQHAPMPGKGKK
jgi:hypothetical protein